MTAPDPRREDSGPADEAAREAARRRRRAAVFGEVLPDATSDERGDWGDRPEGSGDDWLRRQVPPHHG
jgi:hypothetical protein